MSTAAAATNRPIPAAAGLFSGRTSPRRFGHDHGTCRNDGTTPGRGRSAPDAAHDRFPPWREKGLKNRAKVIERAAYTWNEVPRTGEGLDSDPRPSTGGDALQQNRETLGIDRSEGPALPPGRSGQVTTAAIRGMTQITLAYPILINRVSISIISSPRRETGLPAECSKIYNARLKNGPPPRNAQDVHPHGDPSSGAHRARHPDLLREHAADPFRHSRLRKSGRLG